MKNSLLISLLFALLWGNMQAFGVTPETEEFYRIKNVKASEQIAVDVYLTYADEGKNVTTSAYSGEPQIFYLAKAAGGKRQAEHVATGSFLKSGGGNAWNASFAQTSGDLLTVHEIGNEQYRLQGGSGYYSPDEAGDGAWVFCNKGNSVGNGVWSFEEVPQEELKAAIQKGMHVVVDAARGTQQERKPIEGTASETAYEALSAAIEAAEAAAADEGLAATEVIAAYKAVKAAVTDYLDSFSLQADRYYVIRQVSEPADGVAQYLSVRESDQGAVICPAGPELIFHLTKREDGSYRMKNCLTASYLATKGDWNAAYIANADDALAAFTITADGAYYRIKGTKGHLATDAITSGSNIYSNKGETNANGRWDFQLLKDDNAPVAFLKENFGEMLKRARTLYDSENPGEGSSLAVARQTFKAAIEQAESDVEAITDIAGCKAYFTALDEAISEYAAAIVTFYLPKAGKAYHIKNVEASAAEGKDLYLSTRERGVLELVSNPGVQQIFYLAASEGKYAIEHLSSGMGIAVNGYESIFVPTRSLPSALYTFTAEDKYFLIKSNTSGHFALDNTGEGSTVYTDKGNTQKGRLWQFEEVSEEGIKGALALGIPAFLPVAEDVYATEEAAEGSYLARVKEELRAAIDRLDGVTIVTRGAEMTVEEALAAMDHLKTTITTFNKAFAIYLPLKTAIATFQKLVDASNYENKAPLLAAVGAAQAVYDSPTEHSEEQIKAAIAALNSNREPLWAIQALNTAIVNAHRMDDTNYGGDSARATFTAAIKAAEEVYKNPGDESQIRAAIATLNEAVDTYLAGRNPDDWWTTIRNGALWKDDRGETVQAHGAGFLQVGDTWFMIGEDRETAKWNPDINNLSFG